MTKSTLHQQPWRVVEVAVRLFYGILMISTAIAAAQETTSNMTNTSNSSSSNGTSTCTPVLTPTFPRWKMPDCTLVNVPVEASHYIAADMTSSYVGNYSLKIMGDWGDSGGSKNLTEIRDGFIGGQEQITSFNHTYTTVGEYKTTFTFEPLIQNNNNNNGSASLACLGLPNSQTVTLTITVSATTCDAPPTGTASSSWARRRPSLHTNSWLYNVMNIENAISILLSFVVAVVATIM